MTKKVTAVFAALILAFLLSLSAFASDIGDSAIEYDDGLDAYEDLQDDVIKPAAPPVNSEKTWYSDLSPIPLVIGAAVGAAAVFVLFNKHSAARKHAACHPHEKTAQISHSIVTNKKDNSLER